MRRLQALLVVLLVATLVLRIPLSHAQGPDAPPLVVFIEDSRLRTASVMDPGPDGVTQLEAIFQRLGARTVWLSLDEPLPEEARVVVLVRPMVGLSIQQVARLWIHMARGNHLLLAIDPIGLTTYRGEGNVRSNPDRARAGLPTLLSMVYGISLQDTFAAEPWFSIGSITDNTTTHIVSYGEDIVQHPVTEPLAAYDLPVQLWGARTMTVEPIGPHSYAIPLLYTESAYGETDAGIFNDRAPLELNIGTDSQGRLFTGALAENRRTGSRVVVLGDSESLENGFGLATDGAGDPVHPGNWLLTERLIAWLLNVSGEDWPTLPAGYTRTAIDGSAAEWEAIQPVIEDAPGDALLPRYDIVSVRAFTDDSYLYLLVALTEPPKPDVRLTVGIENTFDGVLDVRVALTEHSAGALDAEQNTVPIPDASMAVGDVIEVRLPLRVTGRGAMIGALCLADSRTAADSPPVDCTAETPVLIPTVNTQAPVDVYFAGPRAIVSTLQAGVNVRAAPSENAAVLAIVPNSSVFAATGRTASGDWIQVQTATYTGWLAEFLVKPNVAIEDLPVVSE